jgi:hypothetical protein
MFVPVAHQGDQEDNTAGKKDNATAEAEQIIVGKAMHDEEDGADQKQKPASKLIAFLPFAD